jgi:hypothetical protein
MPRIKFNGKESNKGQGFDKNPQNINRKGRPITMNKMIAELKKAGYERVTGGQVMEVYEILLGMDEDKLKEVIADHNQPMSMRIVGRSMRTKEGVKMIAEMMDRAHGKAKNQTEISGGLNITKIGLDLAEEICE